MNEGMQTLSTPDGAMDAFLVEPAKKGKAPAVVLLQEIFGVNRHFQDLCRRLAREGFLAAAPELFHREGKGIVLRNDEAPRGMQLLAGLTNAGVEMDVRAALSAVRGHPLCNGLAAVMGFCMGGLCAFIAACRTDADASVCFYPGGIKSPRPGIALQPPIGEAERIQKPILCFFGGKDPSIPESDVQSVRVALDRLPVRHEVHVYPEAGHAFFNDERPTYVPSAAQDAWPRTLRFLREAVGQ